MAFVVTVAAGVVLRLYSRSDLWLDETISVNIARQPVPDLFTKLRHDGSPPLYYLLLHGWIGLFGTGDLAVRSLSTLFSLAALPLAWLVGRRLGGRRTAAATLLLFGASPFMIRYATETRMYSLVALLTLLGVWAALRALERPTGRRLALVALVTGLLALTQYWTLFLIAVAWVGLLLTGLGARRGDGGWPPAVRVAAVMPLGGVLFLPWLPSFLFQQAHTGAPWSLPASPRHVLTSLDIWYGAGVWGALAAAVTVALAVAGARADDGARRLLALGALALFLGLAVSRIVGGGFAVRYSMPMLVALLLAAAVGLGRLRPRRGLGAAVAVATLAAVALATGPVLGSRTSAAQLAAPLLKRAHPGDLVVYCPDQMGPAVNRLLPTTMRQVGYPDLGPADLVDWVDYARRNAAASPTAIADRIRSQAGAGTIWLVRADGYHTFGDQCARLDRALATGDRRREVVLRLGDRRGRQQWVISYRASS